MDIKITLNTQAIKSIEQAAEDSAMGAMEQLRSDLISSQTMPFDTGDMQNNQTFIAKTDNGAKLVTGSPQSRRLYYHPEYNFQHGHNANAGAKWLESYINGDKKDFTVNGFVQEFLKRAGM